MFSFKTCALVLMFPSLLAAGLGCSGKNREKDGSSGSASRNSRDGDEALQKENERLKKELIDRLIADGRKALDQKRYEDAKKSFEEALEKDPHDGRAKSGLDDAKEGLKSAQTSSDKDALYAKYMKTGNDAMADKKYALAVRSFKSAYELKGDDEAFNAMTAAQKALDSDATEQAKLTDYQAQIDAGDKLMNTRNYKEALVAYNKALIILPNDPVALKKVAQVEKKLDDLSKNKSDKEKYDGLIADGRRSLGDKHFDAAIQSFTQANNLLPQEADAPRLLKDAKDKQKQAKADYDAAVLQGNLSLQSLMFDIARGYYDQALQAYPDNSDKIATAKAAVLQAETNIAAYNTAILQGKQFMKRKLYEAAAEQFTLALTAIPLDPTATALLKEAADKLKDVKAIYDKAMVIGTRALELKNYSDALKAFEDALAVVPDDLTARAGKRKAEDGLQQQKFDTAVKAGDAAMQAKNYKEAVRQYEIALTIKPGDFSVTGKLNQAKVYAK
jgi:tetratricopeptide (TPR) repeat protein